MIKLPASNIRNGSASPTGPYSLQLRTKSLEGLTGSRRWALPLVYSLRRTIDSFDWPYPSGWVPFIRVHLGQRTGRPAQGRSQNKQHQTRQKRRTTDAGPRTTAPRKTSIPTTTEQTSLLGSRPRPGTRGSLETKRSQARPRGWCHCASESGSYRQRQASGCYRKPASTVNSRVP